MKEPKASIIYEELLNHSKKALSSEDITIQQTLNDLIDFGDFPNYTTILKIISENNEYLRVCMAKTLTSVLIQNGIVINDITPDKLKQINENSL